MLRRDTRRRRARRERRATRARQAQEYDGVLRAHSARRRARRADIIAPRRVLRARADSEYR